ncbi:hypothetical protein C0J52_28072 [Blattella germanica]|nr:hypothetical protein C0J52_28072 [Blattella germanica]
MKSSGRPTVSEQTLDRIRFLKSPSNCPLTNVDVRGQLELISCFDSSETMIAATTTEHYLLKHRLDSKLTHAERRNERWLLLKDQGQRHSNTNLPPCGCATGDA